MKNLLFSLLGFLINANCSPALGAPPPAQPQVERSICPPNEGNFFPISSADGLTPLAWGH